MDSYVTTKDPDTCPRCGGRVGTDGQTLRSGSCTARHSPSRTTDDQQTEHQQEISFHD